jgi:hypothetical protein
MESITYQKFLELLRQMLVKREDAMIYLARSDHRFVVVGLHKGKIVHLACGKEQGTAAIPLIRQTGAGRYRIHPGTPASTMPNLPPTEQILQALVRGQPIPSAEPQSTGHSDINRRIDILRSLLREYVGPMADFIFDDALKRKGGTVGLADLDGFIVELSQSIQPQQKAQQFIAQVHAQFKDIID